MTDIDFDELDKAVNHLMTTADTSESVPTVSNDTPMEVSTSHIDSSAPVGTPDNASTTSESTPSTSSSAPLAVKRRGQFMDIVHPGVGKPAAVPVPRQGVTLQPVTPTLTREEPAASPVPEATTTPDFVAHEMESTGTAEAPVNPLAEPATTETPPSEQPEAFEPIVPTDEPAAAEMPAENVESSSATTEPTDNTDDKSETVTDDIVAEVAATTTPEPLVSPFLPDAQVEKRPLGTPIAFPDTLETILDSKDDDTSPATVESARQDDETNKTPEDVSSVSSHDELNDTPPVAEEPATPPVPAELDKDIMALESADTSPANSGEEVSSTDATPVIPVPVQPPAGGSIAQQYSEQPNSGDQTNGAIYDTATYHKGVETPVVKKTSRLTWLIWALVLVIVGAAAGAGYFYWSTHF